MSTVRINAAEFVSADLTAPSPVRESAVRRRTPVGTEPAPDWRVSAACVDRDLNLFFPISNIGAAARQQIVEAKRVCGGCAVRQNCLEWALEVGPEFGIFGGHTEDERRAIRQQNSAAWRSSPKRVFRSEESVAESMEPH